MLKIIKDTLKYLWLKRDLLQNNIGERKELKMWLGPY